MPRVSVVIPSYNSADTLPRAIESASAQTLDDLEIIVVDDASTDSTDEVVANFDDNRLRYTSHDENKGGSAARNTGIDLAQGEYIAFLDADDEWLPQKLERQVSKLESLSDEWVAVHCDKEREVSWTNRLGYILSRLLGPERADPPKEGGAILIKEILLRNLSTGASTLLVESETVASVGGFNPDFPRHQDWEFLIRILKRGKLAYVDEPLVIKHGTGRPRAEVIDEAKAMLLETFESDVSRWEGEGYPISNRQMLHLSKCYFEEGKFAEGFKKLPVSSLNSRHVLSITWSIGFGVRTALDQSLTNILSLTGTGR